MAGSPDFPAVTMKDSRESRLKDLTIYHNVIILHVTMKDSRESRLKVLFGAQMELHLDGLQ